MAKPESEAKGTLTIPIEVFNTWVLQFLPKGPFYHLEKFKDKGTHIEVPYSSSTSQQPTPEAAKPAPPGAKSG